jgi:hypothetical protein
MSRWRNHRPGDLLNLHHAKDKSGVFPNHPRVQGMKKNLPFSTIFLIFIGLTWLIVEQTQPLLSDHHEDLRLRYWLSKREQSSLVNPSWEPFKWLDLGHASISDQIRLSAQGFDGLFGEPEDDDLLNHSQILTRLGIQKEEGEDPSPLLRFSAKMDLPMMKKRWKLLVNSTTETFFTKRLTGSGDPFRLGESSDNENQVVTTALRWSLIKDVRQILNIDLGAKVRSTPKAYLKANYLKRWPLRNHFEMVFNQHVFGVINDDSGSSTSLDFTRNYGKNRLYRIHHRVSRIFEDDFFTSQVSHSLYQILSPKATLALHASISGDNQTQWRHNDIAFAFQYKRSFFRPWIWFFIEPELHHPRYRDWKRTHQVTLGVETLFGGN